MKDLQFTLTRRQFCHMACGTMAGTLLWGCQNKQKASPDSGDSETTVFHNGIVLPVDDSFSEHQAFAFRGNRLLAIGSNESILSSAGTEARIVDLKGRTVLPGFIEPHIHFMGLSLTGSWLDIGPFKYETTEEALAALKKAAGEGSGDEWIMARQFDPSLQAGLALLTTSELDTISSTRPVFVLNASGHLAYVNSRLLELVGVNRNTPNPPGGEHPHPSANRVSLRYG